MKNYLMFAACSAAIVVCQAADAQPRPSQRSDVLPAEVISAVSNVMAISQLVGRSRDLCSSAFPASQRKFASSASSWQQRNAAVIVQKVKVMAPDGQVLVAAALNSDAVHKVDEMLRPVSRGSSAEQSKWCEQAFLDVDRGRLDLVGRASIAPLMRLAH